ncbi:histidine kinase [Actinomycetes bacterium KLBMP 9759]
MGRGVLGTASVVLAAALAVAAGPVTGPLISGSAGVAVAATVLPRFRRQATAAVGSAASVVSLAASAVLPVVPPPPLHNVAGACLVVEALALMALLVGIVRSAAPAPAAGAGLLACGALAALPLRVAVDAAVPATALELVALSLIGTTAALVAAGAGGYLRMLDHQRVQAVARMRRAERVDFARDLHDFVGHDLTGIVLEAQSAQVVPERAMDALRRIEEVGQAALTSMDHTVALLNDQAESDVPVGGLAELPEVVRRFRSDATATLHVDPATASRTPREIGAIAYRVVVEALTNVRRHTAGTTTVSVVIEAAGSALAVTVSDDGVAVASRGRRGGRFGLVGLAERVEAVGGRLTAGPVAPRGWRVHAVLPLPVGPAHDPGADGR